MQINAAGLEVIKRFEGLHDGNLSAIGLQPKLCPAGIWTIGYGHALRDHNGEFLRGKEGEAEAYRQYGYLTEQGANELLQQDVKEFSAAVEKLLTNPVNDSQFSAMVSFAYNVGIKAFSTSSVLKFFNQGRTADSADAFLLWVKATVKGKKVVLTGLVRRRHAERLLFLT